MDLQRLGGAVPVWVPDFREDLLASENRARIRGEEAEQVELLRRERDRPSVERHTARAAIELQSADGEGAPVVAWDGAACDGADACHQFAETDTLDQGDVRPSRH